MDVSNRNLASVDPHIRVRLFGLAEDHAMTDEEAATRVCKVLQGRSPDPIPINVLKNLSKKATLTDQDFARGVVFAKSKGWIVQKAKIVSLVATSASVDGRKT